MEIGLLNYGGTLGVHREEISREDAFSLATPALIPPELITLLVADWQGNSADLKRCV